VSRAYSDVTASIVTSFNTEGSFGTDMRMIADWLFRRARPKRIPLYGKLWAIVSRLLLPVDWLLNALKVHSEMVVVLRTPER